MMDSTGGRLAVRRRRRMMGSGWHRAEQPLTSRWPATQLRDYKLVELRCLICSSKADDLCLVGWWPSSCRGSPTRARRAFSRTPESSACRHWMPQQLDCSSLSALSAKAKAKRAIRPGQR